LLLLFALPFAFAFASEQKSDNSSFFRMKNEKQDLSSLSWLFSEKNEEKAFHFSF
jgi:hypothetical protein